MTLHSPTGWGKALPFPRGFSNTLNVTILALSHIIQEMSRRAPFLKEG
jgi:hypothetical protein